MMDNNQRIIIQQVSLSTNNIQVELTYSGKAYQKIVLAPASEKERLMAATQATVEAINEIIPTPIVTRVSEVQQVKFDELSEPVLVTLVGVKIKGEERLFPGTARIGNCALNAVVRATLDAVNRPIGLFL